MVTNLPPRSGNLNLFGVLIYFNRATKNQVFLVIALSEKLEPGASHINCTLQLSNISLLPFVAGAITAERAVFHYYHSFCALQSVLKVKSEKPLRPLKGHLLCALNEK